MKLFSIALFALLICVGCNKDDEQGKTQFEIDREIILNYLALNNINAEEDPSGLFYEIIDPGEAEKPDRSSAVEMHYKAYYLDGEVFDETTIDDTSTRLVNSLIEGWSIGVQRIGKGGNIILYIPSVLGYGVSPPYGIRQSAVLIYEIELINIF